MKNSIVFALIGGVLILILFVTDTIGGLLTFGLIFLLGVIGGVWFNIDKQKERNEQTKQLERVLDQLENFSATKKLVGAWGLIAIDNNRKQIAIKEREGSIVKYPYSDIMGCEIIEDGETTYRKSSTIGRAIIGGVIAGGAGAIIGGLSGKEKENKEIKNLDFKILFKDLNRPSFNIRFFDAWEETANTKKSVKLSDSVYGPIFQKSLDNLQDWKDTIEIIINIFVSERIESSNKPLSVTDELTKLNDLKEKGILTEEEFEQQKKKILE